MSETQLHLRLSNDLHQEVKNYAEDYGISAAAAARILIKKGLEASKPALQAKYRYRHGGEQS